MMHQPQSVLPDAIQSTIFDFIGDASGSFENLELDSSQLHDHADDAPTAATAATGEVAVGTIAQPELLSPAELFALMHPASPGFVIRDGLLGTDYARRIRQEAIQMDGGGGGGAGQLRPARMQLLATTSKRGSQWRQSTLRGDRMVWLDAFGRGKGSASDANAAGADPELDASEGRGRAIAGLLRFLRTVGDQIDRVLERTEIKSIACKHETPGSTQTERAWEHCVDIGDTRGWRLDGRTSSQLALFPGNGTQYVRHIDAHEPTPLKVHEYTPGDVSNWAAEEGMAGTQAQAQAKARARARARARQQLSASGSSVRYITAIYYPNANWCEKSGGALRLYLKSRYAVSKSNATGSVCEETFDVSPVQDRLILFRSTEVEHEVMPTFAQRLAITTWMYGTRILDIERTNAAASVLEDTDTCMSGHLRPGPRPDADESISEHTDADADRDNYEDVESSVEANAVVDASAAADMEVDARLDICRMYSAIEESVLPPKMGGTEFAVTAWTHDGVHWPAADIVRDTTISVCEADARTCVDTKATLQTDADGVVRPTPTPIANAISTDGQVAACSADTELIFVSVASYRDNDLRNTLHSMFSCAAHPERLRVGVCAQYKDAPCISTDNYKRNFPSASIDEHHRLDISGDVGTDAGSATVIALPAAWASRVRVLHVDASAAKGPCFARTLIQQRLWAGEPFVMQIDAHMRFVQHWDDALLEELALCEKHVAQIDNQNDNSTDDQGVGVGNSGNCTASGHARGGVVLTTYPPQFPNSCERTPHEASRAQRPTLLCATDFRNGMPRQTGRILTLPSQSSSSLARSNGVPPINSVFWAAGFSFSRSSIMYEVPYRPLPFLFFGEEQYMALRMHERGWRCFAPRRVVLYHQWSRAGRPSFREVQHSHRTVLEQLSVAIVRKALGMLPDGKHTIPARVHAYQCTCGVDFANGTVSEFARNGGQTADAFLSTTTTTCQRFALAMSVKASRATASKVQVEGSAHNTSPRGTEDKNVSTVGKRANLCIENASAPKATSQSASTYLRENHEHDMIDDDGDDISWSVDDLD